MLYVILKYCLKNWKNNYYDESQDDSLQHITTGNTLQQLCLDSCQVPWNRLASFHIPEWCCSSIQCWIGTPRHFFGSLLLRTTWNHEKRLNLYRSKYYQLGIFVQCRILLSRTSNRFILVQVFEAVISWAMNNIDSRRECISTLMEHVRLPLLSQDYLVQRVEDEPLIKNSTRCKDFLIEAMKYHLLRPEQKLLYMTPRTKPRSPAGLPKVYSQSACFSRFKIFSIQLFFVVFISSYQPSGVFVSVPYVPMSPLKGPK